MNLSILQSSNSRPLFIDFDLYTDGDLDFKKELVVLMIDNLQELQKSLQTALQQNNVETFQKTCHKIKPTLSMLEDPDLLDTVEEIKGLFMNTAGRQEKVLILNSLCAGIIQSLKKLD